MRLLGVSGATVARWARTGRLPATRPTRGRLYDIGGVLEAKAAAQRAAEAAARDKLSCRTPAGWMLLADAASDLGISRNPLRRAVRTGELSARRHRGRHLINKVELYNWIEGHRRQRGRRRRPIATGSQPPTLD